MADTIRILVATDNHVGAHERDATRNDDSWKTFDEIMRLAKDREVDMVLLAGDLFHENKPSRKSMYNVMRSLRQNCLGPRPCELEMLSDPSQHFDSTFDHVNYEDPDINVSIPVFSIHGNHDDPSGDGHYAALDLLAASGLINYFGRTPQSNDIEVRPVLLQKGRTKLALYGLSNVRDERLYRTFRDGGVRFYQSSTQQRDWFNMICVHQNHFAHTETSYLPENFLPQFLDLVIWGHEHECDMEPHLNPEMGFRVMQPGSSVATSLMPGEAVPKHVTIVSVTGREFKSEPIRLRTVRPFVYRDVVLAKDKIAVKIGQKDNHRTELTRHLISIVESMIAEGEKQWQELHADDPVSTQHSDDDDDEEAAKARLPLIRLRVDTMKPDGVSKFEVENPQRFSNRFAGQVANVNDVIQFTTRKKATSGARNKADLEAEQEIMSRMQAVEDIRVDKLVREFLEAQSLTILPTNYFGDAVTQFVDKDDKHAMEMFVNDSLANQIKELVRMQNDGDAGDDEDDLVKRIEEIREGLERDFAEGIRKAKKSSRRLKPKPKEWDSDEEGEWEDNPAALIRSDDDGEEDDDDDEDGTPAPKSTRGGRGAARGRAGRGARGAAASSRGRGTTRGKAATSSARSKKQVISEDEEDSDEDVVMLDDDDEGDSQALFYTDQKSKPSRTIGTTSSSRSKPSSSTTRAKGKARATSPPVKKPPARAAASRSRGGAKQGTLNFTTSQQSVLGRRGRGGSLSDDIDDEEEEDAFEDVSQAVTSGRRR